MCGITGYFSKQKKSEQERFLTQAISQLSKRGPDANGSVFSESKHLGLGHARLSIIDTSSGANQPMTTIDKKYSLVFNGEIYNYKDLRRSLVSKGYQFNTESDTEVLLNLFHLYKNDCWAMLNGFFAVAIYDYHTDELILARDRFGIKPLLYAYNEGDLYFASEMKSILEFPIERKIDNDALHNYFSFNYIPTPHSIIDGIEKLEQGHYLKINSEGIQKTAFYELEKASKASSSTLSYDQAQTKLVSLMEESVSDRLVSDVPLGTFLSGGIDSSIITALASNQTNGIDTFSIGFKDNEFFDETHYARLVADKFKTNHHEFKLSNDDIYNSLQNLLDYTDEPFADSSALAVNVLCQETKKHVTVALSGDGADEIFAGYNKYQGEFRVQNPSAKETLASMLYPLWKSLPKSRNTELTNTFRKLYKYSSGSKLTKKERYLAWCSIGKEKDVNDLLKASYSTDYKDKLDHITRFIHKKKGINDVLANDINLVLTNDMLTKVDLMSMNNSLEVRVPFLDHRVVEFANSLPESYKINKTQKKRILQDSFRSMLPEELYNRPKQGFEVPMLDWLKNDLNEKIREEYLHPDFLESQNIFDIDYTNKLIKKLHSSNPEDSHAMVWALVVFQNWYKKYMG